MPAKFRIAIVGTGRIAAEGHLPAAIASEDVEVAALVDTVPGRARAIARKFCISPAIFCRVEETFDRVDGVILCTPNQTHFSLARICIQEKIPVLVEKPLATTTLEAEELVRTAEAAGSLVAVGYCTRFLPSVQLMRRLLACNRFGKIRRFAFQLGTTAAYSPESGYNLDRRLAGGGVLIVNGSHFLDRMLYWFGYPERVECKDDSLGGPEATAIVRLHYVGAKTSFSGEMRFTKAAFLEPGFVMETDEGTVILAERPGSHVQLIPRDCPDAESVFFFRRQAEERGRKDVFRLQLDDFVRAAREGRDPMVTAREGAMSVRLIEELYSARTPLSVC